MHLSIPYIYRQPVIKVEDEKKESEPKVIIKPLKSIGSYTPPTFTIEGRITHIEPITKLFIKNQPKSFFYAVITDVHATSMKINFWELQAIQHYANLKKEGLYQVSKIKVYEPRNAKYAMYGPIELTCTQNTKFIAVNETSSKQFILPQHWRFVENISSIATKQVNSKIDVLGLICDLQEPREVTVGNGSSRRVTNVLSFNLFDETGKINCSCWREKANVKLKEHQIIAVKKARVINYGGCSLTVLGYIEEKPRHQKVDELITWKQTQNAALKQLIEAAKNVTNSESMKTVRDYSKARTVQISDLIILKDTHYFTHTLPTETLFKVSAKIQKIQNNMFFQKQNKWHWRLRLDLSNEPDEKITAVAFEIPATKIMNNLSAKAAIKMQTEETDKFTEMVEKLHNADAHLFSIYCKKRLGFVVEEVEKRN